MGKRPRLSSHIWRKFSEILEDQHLSLRKLLWKFKGKCFIAQQQITKCHLQRMWGKCYLFSCWYVHLKKSVPWKQHCNMCQLEMLNGNNMEVSWLRKWCCNCRQVESSSWKGLFTLKWFQFRIVASNWSWGGLTNPHLLFALSLCHHLQY